MVTEKGVVKILDFGLAKLAHPATGEESTVAQSSLTESGMILGTVAYMSPEQAEGKAVDARSDIFAFGAVLYEMVTGRRAFQGDSNISTLAAVLHEEPAPVSRIAAGIPAELERIITRCLRKAPGRRFQHLDDVKVALEELREEAARRGRPRLKYWMAAAAVAVVAVGIWAFLRFLPQEEEPLPPARVIQVTSSRAEKIQPALSPDGNWLAFVSNGENRNNWDIYVKDLGSPGEPVRLTTDPQFDSWPVWHPDGRQIAFRRGDSPDPFSPRLLCLVSPLGGSERVVADIGGYQLDPSPDRRSLAFCSDPASDLTAQRLLPGIWSITLETLEKRQLVKSPPGVLSDSTARYSPDGRYLAFVRRSGQVRWAIYRMRLPDGEPELVTEYGNPYSFCWTADSREIVFASGFNAGEVTLWRIAAEGGQPRRVAVRGERTSWPSIRRNRLAYVNDTGSEDIWRINLTGSDELKPPAEPLLSWPTNEYHAAVSPDGTKITFQSDRSGTMEIWVAGADGANPRPITDMKAPNTGAPSWSPDGKMIVFDSQKSGNLEIWVVRAEGGPARQLTDDPAEDGAARWSRDGRWIYFYSNRSGGADIWKIPPRGGKARQVTREGKVFLFFSESRDGRFLYYFSSGEKPGIYRIPVSGGASSLVFESDGAYFAAMDTGIYFIDSRPRPPVLKFYDFATKQAKNLGPLHSDPAFGINTRIWISPDDQWLYYAGGVFGSEIMLMENFR